MGSRASEREPRYLHPRRCHLIRYDVRVAVIMPNRGIRPLVLRLTEEELLSILPFMGPPKTTPKRKLCALVAWLERLCGLKDPRG